MCRPISFWRGTKCNQLFGLSRKIWTGTKHFGTCKRTRHKRFSSLVYSVNKSRTKDRRVRVELIEILQCHCFVSKNRDLLNFQQAIFQLRLYVGRLAPLFVFWLFVELCVCFSPILFNQYFRTLDFLIHPSYIQNRNLRFDLWYCPQINTSA